MEIKYLEWTYEAYLGSSLSFGNQIGIWEFESEVFSEVEHKTWWQNDRDNLRSPFFCNAM